MIPVRQTNPDGLGNCMAACWASILEVPIESVPLYRVIELAGGNWMNAVNTWLTKHHQVLYVELEPYIAEVTQPLGWHLVIYGSREKGHAVVGFCGRPVWDPMGRVIDRYSPQPYTFGILAALTDDLKVTWLTTWRDCLCPACIKGEG